MTHGRARRRHGTVRDGHHPHPKTTVKSEGDILYAEAQAVMDELARAQQHQARYQDEVTGCREGLDDIVKDLTNFRALLEVACDDLADAGMKTIVFEEEGGRCPRQDMLPQGPVPTWHKRAHEC